MGFPAFNDETEIASKDLIAESAAEATAFLKALSHNGRLQILCYLAEGEKSVSELEHLLGVRQAAVSQQLARLRMEQMVAFRREGKAIYYRLDDDRALETVSLMFKLFCEPKLQQA